jgi:tetratricopeptide (TPR) repeat protein
MIRPAPDHPALTAAREAFKRGDMRAVLTQARLASVIMPNSSEAWWLLGTAANVENDVVTAAHAFDQAARHAAVGSPAKAQMLVLRGPPLMADGRMAEAVETTRAGVRLGLSDPASLVKASYTLTNAGLPQEALPLALMAAKLNPSHAEAWYSLGSVQRTLGDIDAAEAAFKTAITLTKSPVSAYFNLAYLKRWTPDNNHIADLEALACQSSLEACRVAYALFKEYNDTGQPEAALDCLQLGAGLAKKLETWTSDEEAAMVAAWKEYLPGERLATRDDRPRSGPKRIFIIGLPRSGTTLIERVLAAHSQVQAIGELKAFGVATRKLCDLDTPARLDPQVIKAAAKLDPLDIAEFYTRETAYLHDGKSAYVIDKLPNNHEYAGLIKLAFPDALIIGLDRNPMDALFGSYKLLFTGAYGWSYTLDDLADHYGHFRDLMAYWKEVLGDGLIHVSLEAVIQDPETEIRCLLNACGLPFEEACLRPHEAKGAVSTASAVQVRKPINAEGVGAWKRYANHLEPLKQRLGAMGYLPLDKEPS